VNVDPSLCFLPSPEGNTRLEDMRSAGLVSAQGVLKCCRMAVFPGTYLLTS